jgi:putative nucleotidyltransferase with HDIG domain
LTDLPTAIPAAVHAILGTLWSAGFAAYVVGGSLRDLLLGRPVHDWDLATSARPEQTLELFPGAVYENAFGTVAIRSEDTAIGPVEITTFRTDHDYADFRRPHRVEFGTSIDLDLARRDFTVNAMAWGAEPGASPSLVDLHDASADLAARILRTVGDPMARFSEDALRMVRAVRLAATLGFDIEAGTLAGMRAQAELVRHLSGERIAAELSKILAADRPSIGLRLMSDTGLLARLWPDLAAQRGVPQNKVPGEDLWDHTLRAVDAAASRPTRIRVAALLHDIGKPATMADGRFLGHETVGAALADPFLEGLHWPLAERALIVRLVRHHMFGYLPSWSDAAVRRLMVKVGRDELDDLFLLREADNIGSGLAAGAGGLDELRDRVARQLAAGVVLDLAGLTVDGTDLMTEFGIDPGPLVGRLLDLLLERVIADPSQNSREVLLALARQMLIGMGATHRGSAT